MPDSILLPEVDPKFPGAHREHGDYLPTVYQDFAEIEPHLVKGDVLDIGCGLGALSVLAQRVCGGRLYLLDGDGWTDDRKERFGFSNRIKLYNDLSATREVMRLNGIEDYQILEPFTRKLPEVDNVISTYSWGWHYPFDWYKPRIRPGGVAIAYSRHQVATVLVKRRKGYVVKWENRSNQVKTPQW